MATPKENLAAEADIEANEKDNAASTGDLKDKKSAAEKKDINILILGETGVGKSTWINGIANYAKHNSLQEAMDDPEFTILIPSRFFSPMKKE